MLHIRFDRQNRVVGHWGGLGLDAAELTLDFINANKNRGAIRTKTNENLSAHEKAMKELRK